MQAVGKQMPDGLKKKIVGWAKRTMLAYQVNQQVGGSGVVPFGVGISRKLLVKARIMPPNSNSKPRIKNCALYAAPYALLLQSRPP